MNELQNKYSDRFKIYYTLSEFSNDWAGMKGMINKDDLLKILNENSSDKFKEAEYFICGPGEMMELAKQSLLSENVPADKIHIEYFIPPIHHEEYIPEGEEDDVVKEREVEIILDGSEHKISVPPDTVILDAAINADLDPPYSCKAEYALPAGLNFIRVKLKWMSVKVCQILKLKKVIFLHVSRIR